MAKKNKSSTPAPAAAKPEKRVAAKLTLTLPLARARKLSGDLYEAAGLRLWAEAIDAAAPDARETLIQLQDALCDAGDLFKEAKATNPKHLALFLVACFDRDGLPATPPHYVTAASEDEALAIWKAAFKGEYGRRKPRAERVPERAESSGLHA
jgi:hypothetical protein